MQRVQRADFTTLKDIPAESPEFSVDVHYSRDEFEKISLGVKARDMDERWHILFEDNRLYMHRSWTGLCIFIADFEILSDGAARIVKVTVNGDNAQYKASIPEAGIDSVVSLIRTHLINRPTT